MLTVLRHVIFSALTTSAMLTAVGCSGGALPDGSPSAPREVDALTTSHFAELKCSATAPLMYVSLYTDPRGVYVYSLSGSVPTLCGKLQHEQELNVPNGIFVDGQQNLWVTTVLGESILEFPRGSKTATFALKNQVGFPVSVAVDNRFGTVYVATQGTPSIEVYPKGSSTPSEVWTDPRMDFPNFLAIDDQGNVYVTNSSADSNRVLEFRRKTGKAIDLGLTVMYPTGIATTKSGALALCDFFLGCGEVQRGSTTLVPYFSGLAYEMALNADESLVFVDHNTIVQIWAWPGPQQGPLQTTGTYANSAGVAVSPADAEGMPFR